METKEQAYYDIKDFPKLNEICEKWETIREEFKNLSNTIMKVNRIDKTHEEVYLEVFKYLQEGNEYGWTLGWGKMEGNYDWLQYALILDDQRVPFLNSEMKETVKMFKDVKGIKVCALLKLNPATTLHTHTHPELREQGLLQLHLPIDTALEKNYNYLNVQGEFRQYVKGTPIVFDGAIDHFALNESDKERTTLYIEFNKEILSKK